ncbi:MAG TPA: hypothetical protein ENK08_05280 [Chloroflexi bacterium]|nr:hypothetical protein [Chloroflexota bacterium]
MCFGEETQIERKTFFAWGAVFLGGVLALSLAWGLAPAAQGADVPLTSASPSPPAVPDASPDFPRLGMWWPDPWEQPLTDIARYDWVILGDWAEEFITPLKQINPDILLLNSTNACELSYNPDPDAEPWENEEVRAVPPEWFLTQVGTVLTSDVDTTTTVFHVAEVTVTDGISVYDLFVVSDTALIDGEIVFVEDVDPVARTLTVQRGYVRPAAAHLSGTRIAALVSFWPRSWVMNLSTMCPTATISSAVGPETWADYNARVAVGLLANPAWDGLLIDRSDPNESWLIGNSTARTIDPDRSNTLITDYAEFDAAWNAGLRHYEEAIRDAVGPDRILFVNWGMPNYDLLNGNNFEGFPGDDGTAYGVPWQQVVFGPTPGGSYFDWIERARRPNLTMIETYEDDGGPDPTGSGEYDNPCDDPDFVPNYRKMRFGLATALLNDGYFSYEINTNGHGSLCLLWFDEYDNAGAGRGYLGQPLGPAVRAIPVLTTPNGVRGGDFETADDLAQWNLWADEAEGYTATLSLDGTTAASGTASARIEALQSRGTDWQVEFSFTPTEVLSGTEYTLSFWAKADRGREVTAFLQQGRPPWEVYLWFGSIPLTTTWQRYEMAGTATGTDLAAFLHFGLGEVTGTVWLDGIQLQVGNRNVWRRDYTGGVVLVNATASPQVVPLGRAFRKISGTQVPTINDGSVVTQVVLPPLDGLILLRESTMRIYLPVVLRE